MARRPAPPRTKAAKKTHRPKHGRRRGAETDLEEETVEVTDELFQDGKAERNRAETSYRVRYRRGGMVRVAVRRVKYRVVDSSGKTRIETAPLPPELMNRSLATASLLAYIAHEKYNFGLPLFRLDDRARADGFRIDRGTMSRWMEDVGATFGATVVHAMNDDARARAFCIATDATGFAVQPGPREGPRRPCRKGHYFVRIADRDHIFFDFSVRHTSQVVRALFKGFEGYVQADAASVYDALFRPSNEDDEECDGKVRREVACWSHARVSAARTPSSRARTSCVRLGECI